MLYAFGCCILLLLVPKTVLTLCNLCWWLYVVVILCSVLCMMCVCVCVCVCGAWCGVQYCVAAVCGASQYCVVALVILCSVL